MKRDDRTRWKFLTSVVLVALGMTWAGADDQTDIQLTYRNNKAQANGAPFTGVQTTRWPNGQAKRVAAFRDGVLTHDQHYYESGQLRWDELNDGGVFEYTSYYLNGQKQRHHYHKKGDPAVSQEWDDQGREIQPPPATGSVPGSSLRAPAPTDATVAKRSSRELGFIWRRDPQAPRSLIIDRVVPRTPAAEGKFGAGYVIYAVEKKGIDSPRAFEEAVNGYEPGQRLKVRVTTGLNVSEETYLWLVLPASSGTHAPGPGPSPSVVKNPAATGTGGLPGPRPANPLSNEAAQKMLEKQYARYQGNLTATLTEVIPPVDTHPNDYWVEFQEIPNGIGAGVKVNKRLIVDATTHRIKEVLSHGSER